MTNRGAEVNQPSAQCRGGSYWLVYQALERDRSLSKLHRILADLRLDVSMYTLKDYSVRYKWQERSELVDGAHTAVELANVPREMDERQARLGITMFTIEVRRLPIR